MTAMRPAELLRQLDQDTPDDAELFARFRRGDQGAFAVLVRRHGPLVLAVCRRIANQDAEDAFQATFLTLVRRADSIREPRLIGNWLSGAALRVSKRAKRSAMRRRAREVQAVNSPDPPAPELGVPFEHEAAIHDEIAKLPDAIREAIVLCELRGVSRSDAAAVLGIPEGTLSSRLAAGRKKLAGRLSRRGITLGGVLISLAAVPDGLVASTCRIAAGAAVPAAIERLMSGGFPMRTVLIGVLGFGLTAAGAVFAARPVDPPPLVKEAPAAPQPKTEAKPEAKAETVLKPRLAKTMDVNFKVSRMTYSRDGKWAILESNPYEAEKWIRFISQDTSAKGDMTLSSNQRFVGITPDSKHVVTDLRESGLLSGLHAVRLWHVSSDRGNPMGPPVIGIRFEQTKEHVLDPECERQYGFPAGGETIRTLQTRSAKPGVLNHVEVFEAKIGEAAAKSVFKTDTECESVVLSPSGGKIALLNKMSVVVHDIASGKKVTFDKGLEANPPLKEKEGTRRRVAVFSADEHALFTSLAGRNPMVLPLDGTDPVILQGTESLVMRNEWAGFSPNNRLVSGTAFRRGEASAPGSRALDVTHVLLVWDAKTGAVVKEWSVKREISTPPGQYATEFHPLKPTLAILEPNGNGTRIGFWDFVEEMK
jgi:RNA polymerase sigma factor (sigma-70 family)